MADIVNSAQFERPPAATATGATADESGLSTPPPKAAPVMDEAASIARYERIVSNLHAVVKQQSEELEALRASVAVQQARSEARASNAPLSPISPKADDSAIGATGGEGGATDVFVRDADGSPAAKYRVYHSDVKKKANQSDVSRTLDVDDDDSPRMPRQSQRAFSEASLADNDWERSVERHVLKLLRQHMERADEKIAASLAIRLRRITKEHVEASVKREIARYFRDAAQQADHSLHDFVRRQENEGHDVIPSQKATQADHITERPLHLGRPGGLVFDGEGTYAPMLTERLPRRSASDERKRRERKERQRRTRLHEPTVDDLVAKLSSERGVSPRRQRSARDTIPPVTLTETRARRSEDHYIDRQVNEEIPSVDDLLAEAKERDAMLRKLERQQKVEQKRASRSTSRQFSAQRAVTSRSSSTATSASTVSSADVPPLRTYHTDPVLANAQMIANRVSQSPAPGYAPYNPQPAAAASPPTHFRPSTSPQPSSVDATMISEMAAEDARVENELGRLRAHVAEAEARHDAILHRNAAAAAASAQQQLPVRTNWQSPPKEPLQLPGKQVQYSTSRSGVSPTLYAPAETSALPATENLRTFSLSPESPHASTLRPAQLRPTSATAGRGFSSESSVSSTTTGTEELRGIMRNSARVAAL